MKRNTALSRTYINEFDIDGTLTAQSLSKAHPEPLRRIVRGVLACIGILLCIMPNAGSTSSKEYVDYKTYALYLLDFNVKEYKCLATLYGKESAWNPAASNGSHYGIPQGRSIYLKTADPVSQVKWGIKYSKHRYNGMCNALKHFKTKGWH